MTNQKYGVDPEQIGRHIFSELIAQDWVSLLDHSQLVKFRRDEMVVQQGTRSAGLYIVKSGSLRVERMSLENTTVLARRGAGELLGEMSLLENTQAMASVIADEATELYLIRSLDLRDLLDETPGFAARYYRSLAIHLSGRLREAAVKLELAEANQEPSPESPERKATQEVLFTFIDPSYLL